jgi:serpin B
MHTPTNFGRAALRRSLIGLALSLGLALPEAQSSLTNVNEEKQAMAGLFEAQRAASPVDANVVFAPFSLATALAAAADGADGRTRRAFERTIGLAKGDDTLASYASQLRTGAELVRLEAESVGAQFSSPSKLWIAARTNFHADFLERQEESFGAAPERVDFAAPETLAQINDWVRRETRGKIPSLLDNLDPLSQFALLNASYFKAAWAVPFDPKRTRPRKFTLASGATVQSPMMTHGELQAEYAEGADFQALRVPFRGMFRMVVILPKAGAAAAPPLRVKEWLSTPMPFQRGIGRLVLPRFDVSGGSELTDVLKAAGLAPAFEPCADFSRMTDDDLRLSQVIQRATLAVTEEGAEAAAATAVIVTRSSAVMRPVRFDLVVDRPFFVLIEHPRLPVPLIIARIGNPL